MPTEPIEEEVPFLAESERVDELEVNEDAPIQRHAQRPQRRRMCCVFSLLSASIFGLLLIVSAIYFGTGAFSADTPEQRWIMTSESVSDRFFCFTSQMSVEFTGVFARTNGIVTIADSLT